MYSALGKFLETQSFKDSTCLSKSFLWVFEETLAYIAARLTL
jgi:hypothetical protein